MALEITSENFEAEVLNSDIPVLIDFWAPWCGPCQMILPIIEELAEEVTEVKIGKVNVDENPDLSKKYGVMSIPTLVFIKNGEVVDTKVGALSKEGILEIIQS